MKEIIMGYAIFSDAIGIGCALVFKTREEAVNWLLEKGISTDSAKIVPLMFLSDEDWL